MIGSFTNLLHQIGTLWICFFGWTLLLLHHVRISRLNPWKSSNFFLTLQKVLTQNLFPILFEFSLMIDLLHRFVNYLLFFPIDSRLFEGMNQGWLRNYTTLIGFRQSSHSERLLSFERLSRLSIRNLTLRFLNQYSDWFLISDAFFRWHCHPEELSFLLGI